MRSSSGLFGSCSAFASASSSSLTRPATSSELMRLARMRPAGSANVSNDASSPPLAATNASVRDSPE